MTRGEQKPVLTEPPSQMSARRFVDAFGDVYERSPWVAEAAFAHGLDASADTVEGLSALMAAAVSSATARQQLTLLRTHPDLAGRLALAGEMTASSASEQSAAGLDRCSPQELARFQQLNAAYTEKFGFPFIIAVRGLDRQKILQRFSERLGNSREAEFEEALRQVNRIARLRIRERFAAAPG